MTRVALIHPYWDFWASSVPGDFRGDRERLLARAADALGPGLDVVARALAGDDVEARALVEPCRRADVVVVVSTMAVPPGTTMALLEHLPQTPVLVWALHEEPRLPADFSHSDITTRGATVGAPMVVSALARAGRRYDVVMTDLAGASAAREAVDAAAAAGVVRGATMLRVGTAMPGYTSVVATDEELAPLGIRSVAVTPRELADRIAAVTSGEAGEVRSQLAEEFLVDPDVDLEALERIARVEVALDALVRETGARAGTLNCHVPELRFNTDVGVCPCVALGRLTTRGVPWTCSGDVVTSVAMLTVQALGLPTLYHEVEAVDYEQDEVVLANTGEHDLRLAPERPVRLAPDAWYTGDRLVSPCAQFSIAASRAALVGFVPLEGLRWIVADGDFTGSQYPRTGTPNAGFRFASGHVTQAWPRWLAAGVVHHSAATNARVGDRVERMARHLGGDVVRV
jgi:L-arabinose isomerase